MDISQYYFKRKRVTSPPLLSCLVGWGPGAAAFHFLFQLVCCVMVYVCRTSLWTPYLRVSDTDSIDASPEAFSVFVCCEWGFFTCYLNRGHTGPAAAEVGQFNFTFVFYFAFFIFWILLALSWEGSLFQTCKCFVGQIDAFYLFFLSFVCSFVV